MQIFPCPFCGPRDESEFHYVGEPKARPEPAGSVSDAEWAELSLVQRQSKRRGARDLAASHLHGDVRDDARHGDQRRRRQRNFGEARALTSARLPTGGQVDRGRPLAFTFDGKPYSGFAGDSIASALLANGVRIVGRSFKYHRPRGVWGAWTEEPNAIVDVTRAARRRRTCARPPSRSRTTSPCARSMPRRPRPPIAPLSSTGSRPCCRRVSITRLSYGRAGRPSKARSAPWPASAASIRTIVRRLTIRSSTRAAICLSSAPAPRVSPRRPPPPGRDAWCFSSTIMPRSAASSLIAAARSKAETGATGRSASRAPSKPQAGGS